MWKQRLIGAIPLVESSANPGEISRTLTNALPTVVFLLGLLKINIPQTDLETYAFALAATVTGLRTLYFGVVRIWNWVQWQPFWARLKEKFKK
jgi:hypothetical protein